MAPKWWTLLAVCLATFMLLLDITVVNVALPDLRRDLDASFTDLQWVVDAYALGLAAILVSGGRPPGSPWPSGRSWVAR
jgi:MFS family permease